MLLKLFYWSSKHCVQMMKLVIIDMTTEKYKKLTKFLWYTGHKIKITHFIVTIKWWFFSKNEGKFSNSRGLNETSPIGYELLQKQQQFIIQFFLPWLLVKQDEMELLQHKQQHFGNKILCFIVETWISATKFSNEWHSRIEILEPCLVLEIY